MREILRGRCRRSNVEEAVTDASDSEAPTNRAPPQILPGKELVNPALHLRAVVLESSPQILRAETEAGSGGNGGPLHRHLRQQERFIVREGTIKVRRGLRGSQLVGPGEAIAVPIGTPHTFEVEGAGARFITEFRPAYRIGEFFEALFALATEGRLDRRGNPRPTDLAVLMQRYPEDFFYLPVVPPGIQRALGWPLALRANRRAH
jgi:mannose-6-phosphate isomerase-like protein (cupin superfamily)